MGEGHWEGDKSRQPEEGGASNEHVWRLDRDTGETQHAPPEQVQRLEVAMKEKSTEAWEKLCDVDAAWQQYDGAAWVAIGRSRVDWGEVDILFERMQAHASEDILAKARESAANLWRESAIEQDNALSSKNSDIRAQGEKAHAEYLYMETRLRALDGYFGIKGPDTNRRPEIIEEPEIILDTDGKSEVVEKPDASGETDSSIRAGGGNSGITEEGPIIKRSVDEEAQGADRQAQLLEKEAREDREAAKYARGEIERLQRDFEGEKGWLWNGNGILLLEDEKEFFLRRGASDDERAFGHAMEKLFIEFDGFEQATEELLKEQRPLFEQLASLIEAVKRYDIAGAQYSEALSTWRKEGGARS